MVIHQLVEPVRAEIQTALDTPPTELLQQARTRANQAGLPYSGGLYPPEAWALFKAGLATLVDVRTAEERKYVGHVPDTQHVAWQTGPGMIRNPRFLRDLEKKVGKQEVILLLCRSGKRSSAAAKAAAAAGFENVFNVLEGFEGDLDSNQRRGETGGWRLWGLPWVQD